MVGLVIRIPCRPDIDLSGKCSGLVDFFGDCLPARVQVQLVDPDIGGSCNYHDRFVPRECRPDHWHAPHHHDDAFYGVTLGHSLDVPEGRHGSVGLGRLAGYLYRCADPEAADVDEEGDCAVLAELDPGNL